jgi:hypothetical protein
VISASDLAKQHQPPMFSEKKKIVVYTKCEKNDGRNNVRVAQTVPLDPEQVDPLTLLSKLKPILNYSDSERQVSDPLEGRSSFMSNASPFSEVRAAAMQSSLAQLHPRRGEQPPEDEDWELTDDEGYLSDMRAQSCSPDVVATLNKNEEKDSAEKPERWNCNVLEVSSCASNSNDDTASNTLRLTPRGATVSGRATPNLAGCGDDDDDGATSEESLDYVPYLGQDTFSDSEALEQLSVARRRFEEFGNGFPFGIQEDVEEDRFNQQSPYESDLMFASRKLMPLPIDSASTAMMSRLLSSGSESAHESMSVSLSPSESADTSFSSRGALASLTRSLQFGSAFGASL